jgi:hypothetical protein
MIEPKKYHLSNWFNKRETSMRKKDVRTATRKEPNSSVEQKIQHNDFDVMNVPKLSFGEEMILASDNNNRGLNSGLPKALASGNYADYRVIAIRNLKRSSNIGFQKSQKNN